MHWYAQSCESTQQENELKKELERKDEIIKELQKQLEDARKEVMQQKRVYYTLSLSLCPPPLSLSVSVSVCLSPFLSLYMP